MLTHERILFDTSVYGKLIGEFPIEAKSFHLHSTLRKRFIVYSCNVIRAELRRAPQLPTPTGADLRRSLLHLHDTIVRNQFSIDKEVDALAIAYFKRAKDIGSVKVQSWDSMQNDLSILACATLQRLDVVFTNDLRTMLGRYVVSAVREVNQARGLTSPSLLPYEDLKLILQKELFAVP